MRWMVPVCMLSLALAGCFGGGSDEPGMAPGSEDAETLELYEGFRLPLLALHAGNGSGPLYVVEQAGRVIEVQPNDERRTFADITDRVGADGGEKGLLGMAFHPDYASNSMVLLSYTEPGSTSFDSILARFTVGSDGVLDAASEEILLRVSQPFQNHNGGHIVYGPDGYLYYGLGDGGAAGDPGANGQNLQTLLGSILRIDVGATGPYTVPDDNPFADGGGAAEIWLYGLRNPWRFSFDDAGNLWIGDVGQQAWEEINRVAPDEAGANLGWNTWEGTHHYPTGIEGDGTAPGYLFPVAQYENGDSIHCSVTGGHVIGDRYFFADFCSGHIWSMPADGELGSHGLHLESGLSVASFGQGPDGSTYVIDLGGSVQKLIV